MSTLANIIKFHLENDDFDEPFRIYANHFDDKDVYDKDRLKVLNLFISKIDEFKEKRNMTALSNCAAVFVDQIQYEHVYKRICEAIQSLMQSLSG